MPKKLKQRTVEDPDGVAWHALASERWQAAVDAAPDGRPRGWDQPDFPDFAAKSSAAVTRTDVYGRFLVPLETGIVHDLYAATPACRIDEIRNGTFFHFASELDPETETCDLCFGA